MKKKFRVFDLAVAIALILAVTLVLTNHFNARYAALEAEHKALRMEQIQLDSIKSSLQADVSFTPFSLTRSFSFSMISSVALTPTSARIRISAHPAGRHTEAAVPGACTAPRDTEHRNRQPEP